MDLISQLPDAVLLVILSLLPAKDVVATMVLSKRWQFLWMFVPRLIYDASYQDIEYGRFSRFVEKYLLLHEAPTLEALHFKLGERSGAVDIGVWIRNAVKGCVRELIIEMDCSSSTVPVILPRSLYACCTMLVTLKLNNVTLLDFSSSVSFSSLKTLSLLFVKYPDDEFVKRFLSNCPVLEALVVERDPNDNVTIFTVIVHSLKSLFLRESPNSVYNDARGFVIDAPSLECFDVLDHKGGFCIIENDMRKIVTANVDVTYNLPGKILGSITSTKRLYLCLSTSKSACPVGSVFHRLVNLNICTCETEWLNLLMCLLRGSPKLRALKLEQDIYFSLDDLVSTQKCHTLRNEQPRPCWNEPISVSECIPSSLETLEWVKYEGTGEEKELVAFFLRTGSCLKNVTISSKSTDSDKKLEMIKELTLPSRLSPTCELAFH